VSFFQVEVGISKPYPIPITGKGKREVAVGEFCSLTTARNSLFRGYNKTRLNEGEQGGFVA